MQQVRCDAWASIAGLVQKKSTIFSISLPVFLSGCSAAPSQNILGSFFPSWMLCAGIGVFGAVILRRIIILAGIESMIIAPPLTYIAIAVAITLLVWLIRFGG